MQTVGDRRYELSNHLGNVLEVVTDRKLKIDENTYEPITGVFVSATADGIVDYYIADVVSQSDYYPFGMLLPNRTDAGTNEYRYGFNGMEKDDEVSETSTPAHGNSVVIAGGKRQEQDENGEWVDVYHSDNAYRADTPTEIVVSKNSSMQEVAHETYHLFGTADRYSQSWVQTTRADGSTYYELKTTLHESWSGDLMDGFGTAINSAHTTVFGEYYSGMESGIYTLDFFIDLDSSTGEMKFATDSQATTDLAPTPTTSSSDSIRPEGVEEPSQEDGSF